MAEDRRFRLRQDSAYIQGALDAYGNMAPAYSESSTYQLGQTVIHDGGLFICTTAITTPESWTAAHWTQTYIANLSPIRVDEGGAYYIE